MFAQVSRNEQLSFFIHFAGFIAGIIGVAFLALMHTASPGAKAITMIYGISLLFMFGASSAYHYNKRAENAVTVWRKVDHLAIFVMIAGSYTPFSYHYLSGVWSVSIIAVQWGLVAAGFFFKLYMINSPRWIGTMIYVIMGWIVIIPIKQFVSHAPAAVTALLFTGGLLYTTGAVIYGIKKPNPVPGYFGFHEIFHIFILLGAGAHFAAIYFASSVF